MNDILARRAKRTTWGIALSAALVAGITPATAIAAEDPSAFTATASQASSAIDDSSTLQVETANANETIAAAIVAKDNAHTAMQEALKNLEAAQDAASPEEIARIEAEIAELQAKYDEELAEIAKEKELLPAMQADVDKAQAKYDEAVNRVNDLRKKYEEALSNPGSPGDKTYYETLKQLRAEIIEAGVTVSVREDNLSHERQMLERREITIRNHEAVAEVYKAYLDEAIAERNALLGDLANAETAYDDACKAYAEAEAAVEKATSTEMTKPSEPPSTDESAIPASPKQTEPSSSAGTLASTGDATPFAGALAGAAVAGLGVAAAAARRIEKLKLLLRRERL